MIPSEVAGVKVEDQDKWLILIQRAAKEWRGTTVDSVESGSYSFS